MFPPPEANSHAWHNVFLSDTKPTMFWESKYAHANDSHASDDTRVALREMASPETPFPYKRKIPPDDVHRSGNKPCWTDLKLLTALATSMLVLFISLSSGTSEFICVWVFSFWNSKWWHQLSGLRSRCDKILKACNSSRSIARCLHRHAFILSVKLYTSCVV